jgi:hypothetical protein
VQTFQQSQFPLLSQRDGHAEWVYLADHLTDGGRRADSYADDGRTDHHHGYSHGRSFDHDRELKPDDGGANADRHHARRSNRSAGLEVDL